MRMRKKKHGAERLSRCAHLLIEKPESPITDTERDFSRVAPLHLEIGCGKGAFACGMAEMHPDVCFYAMERVKDVMVLAAEKASDRRESRPADNLRFILGDAGNLTEWFSEGSVDTIYLNFSDPWPKKGYAKRRLTHRRFLQLYARLLREDGTVRFKTDNRPLFDFTLLELSELGITPDFVTFDLHNSAYNEGNVMTEYEESFSSQGVPINCLQFRFPKNFLKEDL